MNKKVPKLAYPIFRKQEPPFKRHKTAASHVPKLAYPVFRKQEPPFKRHKTPRWDAWSHFCISDFYNCDTINALANITQKRFRKLPSAARFCTKRFRRFDFWTFFLSIFSKFFRLLNIDKFEFFPFFRGF